MSLDVVHIDVETKSAIDLRKVGQHRYAEDESTDLWCVCYAFGAGPMTWVPGQPLPADIVRHVEDGGTFTAHNAAFERAIWHYVLTPRYGWPEPQVEQWDCTMARALVMSLPRSLDQCAEIVGTSEKKDSEGGKLMMQMCRPRKIVDPEAKEYETLKKALWSTADPDCRYCDGHGEFYGNLGISCGCVGHPGLTMRKDGRIIVWWYSPERLARLCKYCEQDVATERALDKFLRPLSPSERKLFHLDARINDRGLLIDRSAVDNARKIVADTIAWLTEEMRVLTLGDAGPRQVKELVAWLRRAGVDTDGVAKDEIKRMLALPDLSADVRRVIEIRNDAGKSAHAKLDAMLARVCSDGRVRGNFVYHVAHTGRWAGVGVQVQNMKRPDGTIDLEDGIRAIMEGWDARMIDLMIGPPLEVVGQCMRQLIVSAI